MYTFPLIKQSPYFQELLEEALLLPINKWLNSNNVEISVYEKEELQGGAPAVIRASTDVERMHAETDVVLTLSMLECSTYSRIDLLVLISHMLNMIELGYSGGDDAPVIFIRQNKYTVSPNVLKFFGAGNKVYRQVFDAIKGSESGEYQDYTGKEAEPGQYESIEKEYPSSLHERSGGLYSDL
jgi:hypothetical protein